MRKAKPLYGKMVYRKCYYKFTNRRQFAYLIDALLWQPITYIAGIPFGMFMLALVPGITQQQLYWAGTAFGYLLFLIFACKDGFAGQSLGKMIAGVQVVDESSYEPIGFGGSLKRNLCIAIPFVVLVILIRMPNGKRPGDRWANSRVIWKKFKHNPVFTGGPLVEADNVFLPGDGQAPVQDDNPYASPR
jgi:uncharacterized RDD family membrane protein YckC